MLTISDAEKQQLLDVISMNDIHVHQVLVLIEQRKKVIDVTTLEIELIVDYTKTIEQAIAEGKYNIAAFEINEKNFPVAPDLIGKKVIVKSRLFNFERELITEHVIWEMKQVAYRPANLMELAAFGAARPELQRLITITAFGSRWMDNDGYYNVPCLHVHNNRRYLNTTLWGHMFPTRCFTLGIPQ